MAEAFRATKVLAFMNGHPGNGLVFSTRPLDSRHAPVPVPAAHGRTN